MNINLDKSVYFDNYLKLLALIHGVEYGFVNYTIKGKLNKKYCKVEFEDINQDAYCNIFTLKNIFSKTGIKIKNINLNGKFNLKNLTNINPGTYSFYSRPKITT